MTDSMKLAESCHDRVALVCLAMRAGMTEDATRGALVILEEVKRDMGRLGVEE